MMKVAEIRAMSDDELNAKLKALKTELFNLRFAQATGSLSNPMQLHNIKKDIAKINTILRERKA